MRSWSNNSGDAESQYVLMGADPEADVDVVVVSDPDELASPRTDDADDTTLADDQDTSDDDDEADLDTESFPPTASSETSLQEGRHQITLREKMTRIVTSIWWQSGVFLFILLDIIFLIIQMYAFYGSSREADDLNQKFAPNSSFTILTTFIVVILLAEVLVRLAVLGKYFWKDYLNIFDLVVMVVSFILQIIVVNAIAGSFVIVLRVVRIATRVVRVVIKIIQGKRNLNKAVRSVVTENKMRYTKDGWDLDLAYITDRVMVMSLPAWDYRTLFRNQILMM